MLGAFMSFQVKKYITCPQCGDSLPMYVSYAKVAKCDSCKSTIFIEDKGLRLAGESSVLSDEVSLIKLNTPFTYKNHSFLPVGMVRYSYGRGFWEEWWLQRNDGENFWLSVDEGDMVLEKEIENIYETLNFSKLSLGKMLDKKYIITEVGEAKVEGFEGSLPNSVDVNVVFKYLHLSEKNANLITIEQVGNQMSTYKGIWIDSFLIKDVYE